MATKTYMRVDVRHDHSFRIPNPKLATALGSLDPCSSCHEDSPAAMNRLVERAAAPSTFEALAAGHLNRYDAYPALIEIANDRTAPLKQRAQALRLLARYDKPRALDAARGALADPHPLIRIAAAKRRQASRGAAMGRDQATARRSRTGRSLQRRRSRRRLSGATDREPGGGTHPRRRRRLHQNARARWRPSGITRRARCSAREYG